MWLNKVSNFAMENDRIPIFWDDMYLKHGGVWNVTRNTELSRVDVEKKLNKKVFLKLWCKVQKNWVNNPISLESFGIKS